MRRLTVLALCFYATFAHAQWQWKDNNGSMVFSDQPPPATIKPSQIVKRPSAEAPAAAPTANAPTSAPAENKETKEVKKDAPKSLAEKDADFRKRRQESADNEKKLLEETQRKQAQRENCNRLNSYLRSLENGERVVSTDANGEKAHLDDAQRQTEIDKSKKAMKEQCQ